MISLIVKSRNFVLQMTFLLPEEDKAELSRSALENELKPAF